jgi:transcriptional regulator with XRE-family HTH domain
MSELKKEIGRRIKAVRKQKKMSLEALGAVIGVGKSSVHGYEAGENYPTPEALIKIAELGDKSLDWLLTGSTDEARTYPQLSSLHGWVKEARPLDLALIKNTIEGVEKHLQDNAIALPPATIAKLVVVLYEEAVDSDCPAVGQATIARMIDLLT